MRIGIIWIQECYRVLDNNHVNVGDIFDNDNLTIKLHLPFDIFEKCGFIYLG